MRKYFRSRPRMKNHTRFTHLDDVIKPLSLEEGHNLKIATGPEGKKFQVVYDSSVKKTRIINLSLDEIRKGGYFGRIINPGKEQDAELDAYGFIHKKDLASHKRSKLSYYKQTKRLHTNATLPRRISVSYNGNKSPNNRPIYANSSMN